MFGLPLRLLKFMDIPQLKSIAAQVRRDIVRMVHAVQSGHPGGSLGCADSGLGSLRGWLGRGTFLVAVLASSVSSFGTLRRLPAKAA